MKKVMAAGKISKENGKIVSSRGKAIPNKDSIETGNEINSWQTGPVE